MYSKDRFQNHQFGWGGKVGGGGGGALYLMVKKKFLIVRMFSVQHAERGQGLSMEKGGATV